MTQYFATAPTEEFLWWCLGSGLLLVAGLATSFSYLRRTRLLEDMPTSRLRSAAQGYVEVEGIARLAEGPPIIAPLTLTRCVWWRFRVEQKVQSGKKTQWRTVRSGTSDECFELDDGTGKCMVDPDHATVIPTHHQCWYGSSERPDTGPEFGRGLLRSGFARYRYTEERIHPAEPVYAIGAFRTQAGGPDMLDHDADLKDLLHKWKHDKAMMALLDINKDGQVDQREWEAARRMAARKVRDEHVQRAAGMPDLHVLAKPRDNRPYILSGVPQAKLIRRWRMQAGGSFAVAAIAAGVLFTALLARGFVT